MLIKKLLSLATNTYFRQQIRFIKGKREVNLKNPIKEAELPIFQYPISKKDDLRVYIWGYVDTGALGLGYKQANKRNEAVKSPTRLSFAEKFDVTDFVSGFGFTVFAVKSTDRIKIYGTGINTDSQLGYQQFQNKSQDILFYPQPITLPIQDENTKVLKLSAGRAHLLVLTTEGLFTLGNNSYGQCGRDIIEDEKYSGNSFVNHIPHVDGQKIIDVQCGQDHSLLLTESGEIYGCGWGADGQTGLGHYNTETKFTKLAGDIKGEKITKITCQSDCVLAINDRGELFGWGNSEYGQLLSNSDIQQICTPIKLKHSNEIGKVIDIASGGCFCMALSEDHSVYVWGYGLLGKGPVVQLSYKPLNIPSILFGQNDFQPNNKVVSISCGMGHMAAVTNLGDLYMWGKNRNGCLGLGHKNDQYFPLKVAIGSSVTKVSCGLDHSVALCKPYV